MIKKTAVVGGDMRHSILARLLAEDGHEVGVYGASNDEEFGMLGKIENEKELCGYECVILPMPVMRDAEYINAPSYAIRAEDVMRSISGGTVVLGGKLPPELVRLHKNISFYDYLEREDFAVKNAVATAEGAIALAINETPFTLWQSKCLVIGYGRIGEMLLERLKQLGAHADAAARSCTDRAWVQSRSCTAHDTSNMKDYIHEYDLIFNTVPHTLLDSDVLESVKPSALIIDLASKPGGVDLKAAKEYGINVIWALSLPGKVAPYTSGRILKETIVNILSEHEKSMGCIERK